MSKNKLITRLTNQGYHIDICSLTKDQIATIENDLTIIPNILDATKEELEKAKFPVYKYSDDKLDLIVPRYYGVSKFGLANTEEFDSEEIDVTFTKQLRDVQKAVCEQCIQYMQRNGGGLLSVPCGFGKTVCAIYIAQRLGLKTLVVVHKTFLIEQWIESILNFLDIDRSKVGIIKQKQCDIVNKDIVVGMIQTISKRSSKSSFRDNLEGFGLVIYDEAHHVACKFFSKSLLITGAQYTLSLTATPYRGDGTIKVMYWFLGGTMYRERFKINKNMIVKIINYKSTDKKMFTVKQRWIKGKMRPDVVKMTSNICKLKSRNKTITDSITKLRSDPARKILVLSGRKDHLEILKNDVDADIQKDIDKGLLDEGEIYSCYYIGSTKPSARREAEERGDIIFATTNMANEALDIKHLNTIILASPKKDVMQSVGRILRTILKTGDVRPLVLDFSDDLDVLGKWLKIRMAIYNSCKYEIENYYLKDDKFKTSLEYKGISLDDVEVHHKDPYIHTAINKHNAITNSFKKDIAKFQKMTKLLDEKFNSAPTDLSKTQDLFKTDHKILCDLEYTNLSDILNVKPLTDKDFTTEIIKKADENTNLNIDEDICQDTETNERTVMQAITNKNYTKAIFTKKLF